MGFSGEMAFRDCPWCGLRDTDMALLMNNAEALRPHQPTRYWSVVSCRRCAGLVAIETNGPQEGPPRVLTTVPADEQGATVAHLPPDIEKFYRDAIRVLEAGVPDAAAVQLRKTLEASAAHFDVKQGPLVGQIQELIDQGLITKGFGNVLDHVRKLGNIGAHAADESVNEEDARRALRFTTQVLRNLFEIPAELRGEQSADDAHPS